MEKTRMRLSPAIKAAVSARLAEAGRLRSARRSPDASAMRKTRRERPVADVLEAEWNAKLWALEEAQREFERSHAEPGQELDEEQRRRILALASDIPRLWNDPATPQRERKRMARLLIEDVTLTKATRSLGVRLRGGAPRAPVAALPPGPVAASALPRIHPLDLIAVDGAIP